MFRDVKISETIGRDDNHKLEKHGIAKIETLDLEELEEIDDPGERLRAIYEPEYSALEDGEELQPGKFILADQDLERLFDMKKWKEQALLLQNGPLSDKGTKWKVKRGRKLILKKWKK